MAKKVEIEQKEIEAPYELPEGWKWVRLGDVVETSKEKTENFSGTMKYIGLEHIEPNGKISGYGSASEIQSLKNVFHQNQILYGKLRPYLNKHDIADFDGVCSTDILVFNAKDGFSNKYVNYFFNLPFFIDFAVSNSKGINLPRVSESTILNISFPLPPTLEEQQRIVNRIESMFAKLDEAKEKAQDVVDSFETRKAAILHQAFTGNLTAKWRKENGVADDSWEEKSLGELLFPMTSKIPSGETFRYIDIDAIDNANQIVESPKLIEVSKAPSRASRGLIENDVLFSMVRPYLKNIAVIDGSLSDCIASTGFYVCRCKPEMNHLYLYNLLCSKDAIDYLMQFMKGDNSPSIRKDDLLGMMINLPSLPEQQEIVRILDAVLEKESRAKEAAQIVLDQIALLKKSILARAFRGEL